MSRVVIEAGGICVLCTSEVDLTYDIYCRGSLKQSSCTAEDTIRILGAKLFAYEYRIKMLTDKNALVRYDQERNTTHHRLK